ncbi:MAG: hypothetical protein ACRDO7_18240 [Nocardioidaceae bacterium]
MDETLVHLDAIEVERCLLDQRGGPFPTTWAGHLVPRPSAGPNTERHGAVPRIGWRRMSGSRTWPEGAVDPPVFAAPAQRPGHWWLAILFQADDSWRPQVAPPVPERPSRGERTVPPLVRGR